MILILIIAFIIITAIIITPIIIKAILNTALGKMDGYKGHVAELDLHLLKSKISLRNMTIRAVADSEPEQPLLHLPVVTILFKWKLLLRRIIDLHIILDKPQMHFVAKETEPVQAEDSTIVQELPSLKNSIEKLMSFKMNVEVIEGEIQYTNPHLHPGWTATLRKFNLTIVDFSNRSILSESCRVRSTCDLYEGTAQINVMVRPLEPNLTLDLDMELKSVNLVLLNDLFKVYGKVDINTGMLDLFGEVAIAENCFKGYLKPIIHNLDFIGNADATDSIFQKIWERIVAGLFTILTNSRNDQVATVIPFEGRLDDPHVRTGTAIIGILRNAFTKAVTPSLENIIDLKSVWHKARVETKEMIDRIFKS